MNTLQTNIPKLRFPEFKDEWVEKRFNDLFSEFKSGQGITSSEISKNGNYPVYGGNGLRGYSERYSHNGFYLLIGRQGALCGNINRSSGRAYISEHAIACKANETSDTEWLAQRLDYFNLNKLSESSAQPGLSVNKILRYKLIVPKLIEQKKIASFFTVVDKKITQLQSKKDLLQDYKKGVMQQIFSQHLRFQNDNGSAFPDWEEKRLGEIGKTLNGLTGKTKENFGIGKPYIQYKQIFDSSKIKIEDCGLVDILPNEKQTKVQFGDIFFTTSSETPNEIGTTSVLLDDVEEMYLNSFCFGLRIENGLNPSFAQFLFRSSKFRKKMIPLAQGSTRYNISKSSFLKLMINLPCIEEQTKIANFLSAIDEKIKLVNTQLENTQQFKKGLLQQMFV